MTSKLKMVLERAQTWPEDAQAELAEIALEIEATLSGRTYQATTAELQAIDDGDQSGTASDAEVAAAFAMFRRA